MMKKPVSQGAGFYMQSFVAVLLWLDSIQILPHFLHKKSDRVALIPEI